MGAIGAILAGAADERVAAVVATSSPADPYRLTRQTFRLAHLPIPDPIAYPLAWLTTRVYLRPRGHRVGDDQRVDRPRRARPAGPARPRRRRRRRAGRPLEAPAAGGGGVRAAPSSPLVIAGGRHSWLYEFEEYRRAVAGVPRGGARRTLLPGGGRRPRRSRPRHPHPRPARPRSRRCEAEPGGFRTLASVALPRPPARLPRRRSRIPAAPEADLRRRRIGRRGRSSVWEAISTKRAVRQFANRPLEAGAPRPDPARPAGEPAARRTSSAGSSSCAATGTTCASSSAVGPYAGHLAGAAVGIALVTPRLGGCRRTAVGHVRPRPGRRLHDARGMGARDRQRAGDGLRARTSRGACSAIRRPTTASTCSRSAIRRTRPTSRRRTSPAAGGRSPRSSTRSAGSGGRTAELRPVRPSRPPTASGKIARRSRSRRRASRRGRRSRSTAARTASRRPSPGAAHRRGR